MKIYNGVDKFFFGIIGSNILRAQLSVQDNDSNTNVRVHDGEMYY